MTKHQMLLIILGLIAPGQNPKIEYHFIDTQRWSLQLTNITPTFDVKSESVYYGSPHIGSNIERWYCLQTAVLKEQSLGNRKMTVEFSTSVDQTLEIEIPKTF